jgi:formamidopyrimidine-DNA glycosylase
MPELPEVETTVRCLRTEFLEHKISRVKFFRSNLRDPIPISQIKKHGVGATIDNFERRGKYILAHIGEKSLVMHLGMSGNVLSQTSSSPKQKHTHFVFDLVNPKTKQKKFLHYVDPRRFGRLDILARDTWQEHKYFAAMGPEPLDTRNLGKYLLEKSDKRKTPVKSFVMDQKTVVGVGNIYACEALFLSKIHPMRTASEISPSEYNLLAKNIKTVLRRAIKQGGTSFKDFKGLDGEPSGYFSVRLNVYNRKDQACKKCSTAIENIAITGRSSFYCPKCQKEK